jgi:hypothetical protein
MAQLTNMVVKNISLVNKPANRRRFLLMKADGGDMEKAEKETPAVQEREKLIAAYLYKHPAETRTNAVNAVYQANPGLYERCRKEETNTKHGQTLSEIYDRVKVSGMEKSADAEVLEKASQVMSKSEDLTLAQAQDIVFRENPGLYERWRQESYA